MIGMPVLHASLLLLDGVLARDEAVFGVLEGGDEEGVEETDDEDVPPHNCEIRASTVARFLRENIHYDSWF